MEPPQSTALVLPVKLCPDADGGVPLYLPPKAEDVDAAAEDEARAAAVAPPPETPNVDIRGAVPPVLPPPLADGAAAAPPGGDWPDAEPEAC